MPFRISVTRWTFLMRHCICSAKARGWHEREAGVSMSIIMTRARDQAKARGWHEREAGMSMIMTRAAFTKE